MAASSCPMRAGKELASPPLCHKTGSRAGLHRRFPSSTQLSCHTSCLQHTSTLTMPKEEFFVNMTCEGCSGAVKRVLDRLPDVQYDIDLPNKKVTIQSDQHSVDKLLDTLKKTGKEAKYLGCKE